MAQIHQDNRDISAYITNVQDQRTIAHVTHQHHNVLVMPPLDPQPLQHVLELKSDVAQQLAMLVQHLQARFA